MEERIHNESEVRDVIKCKLDLKFAHTVCDIPHAQLAKNSTSLFYGNNVYNRKFQISPVAKVACDKPGVEFSEYVRTLNIKIF